MESRDRSGPVRLPYPLHDRNTADLTRSIFPPQTADTKEAKPVRPSLEEPRTQVRTRTRLRTAGGGAEETNSRLGGVSDSLSDTLISVS